MSWDIVLYGATGFTGRQAAAFLADHAPPGLRLAIAGRRLDALEAVAASLSREVGVLVADASDQAALDRMVRGARVVASTAGPFARYGDGVVAAAMAHGAHYCDITGETPWVRGLIDRYHAVAVAQGTTLVPFSGFDSVPSDLGVLLLAQAARERGAGLGRVQAAFAMKGGFNGGTLASSLAMAEDGHLGALADPFALVPEGGDAALAQSQRYPRFDTETGRWHTAFLMAPVNTAVVRRSAALAALAGESYGARFAYGEAMETRSRLQAFALAQGLRFGPLALRSATIRRLLARFGPSPGEGPSQAERDGGFFRARFRGELDTGEVLHAEVSATGDPGNRATVQLLGATALHLAEHGGAGGVLTPATAGGSLLIERLRSLGVVAECKEA